MNQLWTNNLYPISQLAQSEQSKNITILSLAGPVYLFRREYSKEAWPDLAVVLHWQCASLGLGRRNGGRAAVIRKGSI
jgi:hypothetical protein